MGGRLVGTVGQGWRFPLSSVCRSKALHRSPDRDGRRVRVRLMGMNDSLPFRRGKFALERESERERESKSEKVRSGRRTRRRARAGALPRPPPTIPHPQPIFPSFPPPPPHLLPASLLPPPTHGSLHPRVLFPFFQSSRNKYKNQLDTMVCTRNSFCGQPRCAVGSHASHSSCCAAAPVSCSCAQCAFWTTMRE